MKSPLSERLVATATLGLIAIGVAPSGAQTADELITSRHVMVRQRLEPAEPVFVGQPVRLWIEVMTRTWFLQAPRYPTTIEVRNAIVIPPEAFAVNSTERIGGETYAVQGRAYTVFPQRTGRFEIPPVGVTLMVARDDASRSPEIELHTEPVSVEARLPAGAEGHGLVLSTPDLSVSETYSRSAEDLRVGDSLGRQVTMTIEDSVAMLLPPIRFGAAEGVAVYPGRPEVTDRRDRGRLTGTRIEAATYVMEAEGDYRLPEVSVWWWNLRTASLEEAILPAVSFTVGANTDLAAEHLGELHGEEEGLAEEAAAEDERGPSWQAVGGFAAALLLTLYLARRVGHRAARGAERRHRETESEAASFRRFEDTARGGDPRATHTALIRWLDRFAAAGGVATVGDFVARADDEELERQYQALEQILFGRHGAVEPESWPTWRFAKAVKRARMRLSTRGPKEGSARTALPPLNPEIALGMIRCAELKGGMK